jgi:AcrR family transcriptional regulator
LQPRTPSLKGQDERPLRADARRNYDCLVAAADAAFIEHGADASLEDIARRAGVGIGTLYRHFPTRLDLLAKVLSTSVDALVARADALAASLPPTDALVAWLEAMVRYLATYNGISEALCASFDDPQSQLGCSCQLMSAAGERLFVRAQDAGELRRDAQFKDLMIGTQAAGWAAEQTGEREAASRLLHMLVDGLRTCPAARDAAGAGAKVRPPERPRRARKPRSRPAARKRRSRPWS